MNRYKKTELLDLNLIEKRLGYHLTNNPNRLMTSPPAFVTIHNTDNTSVGADADNHHRYLANDGWGRKVSWHYTVDEKQAIQHFRDERVTWHSGTTAGNESSISIELAMDADKAGEAMMGEANYRMTLINGAKLVALLLTEYNLTLADVRQHYDWSGKNCPSQIRRARYGITWDDFRGMVSKYYDMLQAKPETIPEAPQDPLNGPYEVDSSKLWFRAVAGSHETRGAAEAEVQKLIKDGYKSAWLQAVYLPVKE